MRPACTRASAAGATPFGSDPSLPPRNPPRTLPVAAAASTKPSVAEPTAAVAAPPARRRTQPAPEQ